jgi:hypothetical protein
MQHSLMWGQRGSFSSEFNFRSALCAAVATIVGDFFLRFMARPEALRFLLRIGFVATPN